jgi:hypothetical protein
VTKEERLFRQYCDSYQHKPRIRKRKKKAKPNKKVKVAEKKEVFESQGRGKEAALPTGSRE